MEHTTTRVNVTVKKNLRRPKDAYKSRVYAWENATRFNIPENKQLSFDECVSLVNKVWKDHFPHVPVPSVAVSRGRTSYGSSHRITLSQNHGMNSWIVLHEACHSLTHFHSFRPKIGPCLAHGAEFLRLLINLVSRYLHVPAGPLRASARAARLPVAPNSSVPQRRTNKNRGKMTLVA